MSTANKNKTIQTLDESLNKSIGNEAKWINFRNDLLLPLMRTNGRREKFPAGFDESDTEPTAYTFDRIYPASTNIGRRSHLEYLATMFHNEMIHARDSDSATIAKDFNRTYNDETFYSMVRPVGKWDETANGSSKILVELWRNGVTFPFTHNISADKIETIDGGNLYKWTLTNESGTINSNNDRERWQKIFAPLTFYQWMPPNSALNTWTFSIDPNIAHTLNWYQFYLNRIAVFKETTTRYATELQRQQDLTRKKNNLTIEFAKKNQDIKRSLRIRAPPKSRTANYDRFVAALDKLYEDFTKHI